MSLRRGQHESARELYCRALIDLRERSPRSVGLVEALAYAASTESRAGLFERAQRLMGAYENWYASREAVARMWLPLLRSALIRRLMSVPTQPSDPLLLRARVAGRAMSLEAAVSYALEPVD